MRDDGPQPSPPSGPSHELKFTFLNALAPTLVRWLQLRCPPDPDHPDGLVSSIYFDSPDGYCLAGKTNSDYLKTKVRWRWYADPDTGEPGDPAFLEIKSKTGSNRSKLRIPTRRTGAWLSRVPLTDSRLLEAGDLLLRRGVLPPRAWYPAFQITYRRWRFLEPCTGGRLCVDAHITAPRVHPRLAPRAPDLALAHGVLEFKTPQDDLPPFLHPLTALGCRRESFSKYLACFRRLRGFG
jgi:hypothetical protein